MKTDGLFDFRVINIPAKYNKPITIFAQGDEHYNSPAFAREKWEYDISEMKDRVRREDCYFIKDGDVFEALSTSERHAFSCGNFHDSNRARWEEEYAREIKQYVKECEFMRGRTLAVFGGNHYFQFYDGTTSDMALAAELKAPYIGVSGYLILNLVIDKHHTHTVKIFVHHGRSSGRKVGSTFNSLEDAAAYFTDADIILSGHDHKAGAVQLPSLRCDMGRGGSWKIKDFHRIVGRTGSYLKAYVPGQRSYAVDAMYRPSTLGCLELRLTPKRFTPQTRPGSKERDDNRWVEIKAVI